VGTRRPDFTVFAALPVDDALVMRMARWCLCFARFQGNGNSRCGNTLQKLPPPPQMRQNFRVSTTAILPAAEQHLLRVIQAVTSLASAQLFMRNHFFSKFERALENQSRGSLNTRRVLTADAARWAMLQKRREAALEARLPWSSSSVFHARMCNEELRRLV